MPVQISKRTTTSKKTRCGGSFRVRAVIAAS
jgi:hypothetical protein